MRPLDAALAYAEKFRWHLFPCHSRDKKRKHPLIKDQHGNATTDPSQLRAWWTRWPDALIGVSAGFKSGVVCLDIDVKRPGQNGFDTLADLGFAVLPITPMQHTASGGLHLLFAQGTEKIRTTTGRLGPGLDVRSDNNHFIAAAPGSGYSADPTYSLDTTPLAPAPNWLNPIPPKISAPPKPVRPAYGLTPYADAAIASACKNIRHAANSVQHEILYKEAFSIGTLAGAGGIPTAFARALLLDAGCGMPNYEATDPWTHKEIQRVVTNGFNAGLRNPRPTIGKR